MGAVEKYKFPLFAKKVYTNVARKPLYRMLQSRYTAQQLNQGDDDGENIKDLRVNQAGFKHC